MKKIVEFSTEKRPWDHPLVARLRNIRMEIYEIPRVGDEVNLSLGGTLKPATYKVLRVRHNTFPPRIPTLRPIPDGNEDIAAHVFVVEVYEPREPSDE